MACEKCWGDAYLRHRCNPSKTQADHYRDLLEERKHNPCTEEQQKGELAAAQGTQESAYVAGGEAAAPSEGRESKWKCETCGTVYAEYINGCPHCWEAGIRSGVRKGVERNTQTPLRERPAPALDELRGLSAKWRESAEKARGFEKAAIKVAMHGCANELDAALSKLTAAQAGERK